MVLVGEKFRPAEDCLGKVGDSLSPKGERWFGCAGFGKIQQCLTWKMAVEPLPPSGGIVGESIGFQIWKLEKSR